MARSAAPLAALLMLACLLVPRPVSSGLSCSDVVNFFNLCFLLPMLPQCCPGLKSLIAATRTRADRQTACNCLKKAIGSRSDIQRGCFDPPPFKCNITIPFPICASADCSKVV